MNDFKLLCDSLICDYNKVVIKNMLRTDEMLMYTRYVDKKEYVIIKMIEK